MHALKSLGGYYCARNYLQLGQVHFEGVSCVLISGRVITYFNSQC